MLKPPVPACCHPPTCPLSSNATKPSGSGVGGETGFAGGSLVATAAVLSGTEPAIAGGGETAGIAACNEAGGVSFGTDGAAGSSALAMPSDDGAERIFHGCEMNSAAAVAARAVKIAAIFRMPPLLGAGPAIVLRAAVGFVRVASGVEPERGSGIGTTMDKAAADCAGWSRRSATR